jgi:hypothetical protein
MARPIVKRPTPTSYRHKTLGGVYQIAYHAQSGAKRVGIPHDDKDDLITLKLVGGNGTSPDWIFTSAFDFEQNFEVYTFPADKTATADAGPSVYGTY